MRQNLPNVVEDIYISSDNENGNASTVSQTENRNASVRFQQGLPDPSTNASSDVNNCTAENNTLTPSEEKTLRQSRLILILLKSQKLSPITPPGSFFLTGLLQAEKRFLCCNAG